MPAERQISSRSDFIIEDDLFHTEGVDLTEKSTSCEVLFSGGDKGIRCKQPSASWLLLPLGSATSPVRILCFKSKQKNTVLTHSVSLF